MTNHSFTILTYNFLNGGKPGDQNQWPKLLNQFKPHLVLAQETRDPVKHLTEQADAHVHWLRMNTKFGTGVVAIGAEITPLTLPNSAAYAAAVEITPPADWPAFIASPLRVVSVHLADKLDGDYWPLARKVMADIASLPPGGDLVIGGDFNLTVGIQGKDRGEYVTSGAARKFLKLMQTEFGLMSAWQAVNPNTELAQTYRHWNSQKRFHLDGIFIPARWYRYLESCAVTNDPDWSGVSDHYPVVATFREQ